MGGLTRYVHSLADGSFFLMESTGTSYATGARDTSFEQNVRSISEVDDAPGLAKVLQRILVLDPQRRPSVSDLLDHPWFAGPAPPAGLASE